MPHVVYLDAKIGVDAAENETSEIIKCGGRSTTRKAWYYEANADTVCIVDVSASLNTGR